MIDQERRGRIMKLERFCIHDGPGIRTVIFMKGCFMRCRWCANPEGQEMGEEWFFRKERCRSCGKCQRAGLEKERAALDVKNVNLSTTTWNRLSQNCSNRVFVPCSTDMTALQLAQIVLKDMIFYGDNGGLTLSGGEALCQADFCEELLRLVRAEGCHTLIETCGFGKSMDMYKLLKQLDEIYFDIKHTDPILHEEYTGKKPDLIYHNLKLADEAGIPITLRVPMIPGFNLNETVIQDLGEIAVHLKHLKEVHLMPYHELGVRKYDWLRREYFMNNMVIPQNEDLEPYALLLRKKKVHVHIGGL